MRRWFGLLALVAVVVALVVGCTPPSSITGLVTGVGGAPVEGAIVEAYPPWSGSPAFVTTTDSTGTYTLASLPPGSYKIRVVPPTGPALVETWYPSGRTPAEATLVTVTATTVTTADVALFGPPDAPPPMPVLGNPRNALGTGDFGTGAAGTPYEREDRWLAISGYCTDREQGERFASGYWNGAGGTSSSPSNSCTGTANPEYRDGEGNEVYYLDLPAGRTYATDVLIWDGNFRTLSTNNVSSNYCDTSGSNPIGEFCPGGAPTEFPLMSTSFRLLGPDATPADDADNPPMADESAPHACAPSNAGATGIHTFAPTSGTTIDSNTTFNPPTQFLSRAGWFNLCRIPSTAPAGRYVLQVRNQSFFGPGTIEKTQGSNGFSLVANRVGDVGLCDVRTDALCPRLSARDSLGLFARRDTTTAEHFLTDLGSELAGGHVQIELWDYAENGTGIQVLAPADTVTCGADPTWTPQTFDWRLVNPTTTGAWTTGVTSLAPSAAFNGGLIEIRFDLPPTWDPPACNRWFKVQATYSSAAVSQDRTTWTVRVEPPTP